MRILYISSSKIPSKNANSVHVMKMSSALQENGHQVTLIATAGSKKLDYFKFYNVKKPFNLILARNVKYIGWLNRIICAIRNLKGKDIIFTRWPLAAIIIALICDKRIILEYHSYPIGLIQKMILKLNLKNKRVYRYIFITNALEKYFINRHAILLSRQHMVLPDGADPEISAQIVPLCKDTQIKCCYIGSFLEGKGVDTVVEIANRIKDIEFNIVGGDDVSIEALKKISLNNNILWHGYLSQDNAMEILKKCHIALLPNKHKVYVDGYKDIGSWTSPLKLFEYMSFGKAIIASDIPVLREILENRVNCLIVESDNINQWVNAINELKININMYNKIALNAKKDLEKKYTWYLRAKISVKE